MDYNCVFADSTVQMCAVEEAERSKCYQAMKDRDKNKEGLEVHVKVIFLP